MRHPVLKGNSNAMFVCIIEENVPPGIFGILIQCKAEFKNIYFPFWKVHLFLFLNGSTSKFNREIWTDTEFRLLTKIDLNLTHLVNLRNCLPKIENSWPQKLIQFLANSVIFYQWLRNQTLVDFSRVIKLLEQMKLFSR